jgi:hypothetical protein
MVTTTGLVIRVPAAALGELPPGPRFSGEPGSGSMFRGPMPGEVPGRATPGPRGRPTAPPEIAPPAEPSTAAARPGRQPTPRTAPEPAQRPLADRLPQVVPAPPAREREDPGPHRMKSQIQEDNIHYGSSIATAADNRRGVTAREFELTQAAAKADALLPRDPLLDPNRREAQMPRSYIQGVDRAKAEQSRLIRTMTIPTGGIPATRTEDINELRVCFDPRNNNLVNCGGRGKVRLDVENLQGHNLRFPR